MNGEQDSEQLQFLVDSTNKEHGVSHNKLQIENKDQKQQISDLTDTITKMKDANAILSKENALFKETIEQQKSDYSKLLTEHQELSDNYTNLQNTKDQDSNTFINQKNHLSAQIDSLKNDIDIHKTSHQETRNDLDELGLKYNDIKTRYQSLTQVYAKQVYENESLKKDLEHQINESKTSADNNKMLHDELTHLKKHINIQYQQKVDPGPLPEISKTVGNITSHNTRGSKPSRR